jgi:NADPH-dependent 2,4-dienoyl-CoA reductase/sulfur reductase-like enzyme
MARLNVAVAKSFARKEWKSGPMTSLSSKFEVVVVGGGPAGLAAACAAAESGQRVALLDETPWIGGQIWRGQHRKDVLTSARKWFSRFRHSGVVLFDRTCVIASPETGVLMAEQDGQPLTLNWEHLVLATGARELFIPFPGWTLPGVLGLGGLLGLVKNGWPVRGQRVLVTGSGPLLLAAAEGLARHGARVVGICEQAARSKVISFGLQLWRHPAKLWQGASLKLRLLAVPFRFGVWPVLCEGTESLRKVMLTDGARTWAEDCDLLACGFGLVPNTELALAVGCEVEGGFVRVNRWQETSVADVYSAGESTGIGGADAALIDGQIAGYAASNEPARAEALFALHDSWQRFRSSLAEAFALRPELARLATDDTIVCRCEDVRMGQLRQFTTWREAKLHSRCGMGACQGRVCGPATKLILGWCPESVRPPVSPARVGSLLSRP